MDKRDNKVFDDFTKTIAIIIAVFSLVALVSAYAPKNVMRGALSETADALKKVNAYCETEISLIAMREEVLKEELLKRKGIIKTEDRWITQGSSLEAVVKQFDDYVYITESVMCYTRPNEKSDEVIELNFRDKVNRRGETKNGWTKLAIEEKETYVKSFYISESYPMGSFEGVELKYSESYDITPNHLTKSKGVCKFNGHKETYYSEKILPGHGLNIPGRHVAEDGTIRDEDGFIVVASDLSYMPRYSCLMTSLGPGKVYDCGCSYGVIDLYVSW